MCSQINTNLNKKGDFILKSTDDNMQVGPLSIYKVFFLALSLMPLCQMLFHYIIILFIACIFHLFAISQTFVETQIIFLFNIQ